MITYLEELIKSFADEVGNSIANTPASEHLFQTRDEKDMKIIPEEQSCAIPSHGGKSSVC